MHPSTHGIITCFKVFNVHLLSCGCDSDSCRCRCCTKLQFLFPAIVAKLSWLKIHRKIIFMLVSSSVYLSVCSCMCLLCLVVDKISCFVFLFPKLRWQNVCQEVWVLKHEMVLLFPLSPFLNAHLVDLFVWYFLG